MTPVRGTVRLVADLALVGEDELVWFLRLLVVAPCVLLGSAIGQAIAGVLVR